jgi:hypothetical protein
MAMEIYAKTVVIWALVRYLVSLTRGKRTKPLVTPFRAVYTIWTVVCSIPLEYQSVPFQPIFIASNHSYPILSMSGDLAC